MKRKRYYSLVACLSAMLFFITFLATSLTTEAAEGDILYTSTSQDWGTSAQNTVTGVGTLNYNYINCTWYFNVPASVFESYTSDYVTLRLVNLYMPHHSYVNNGDGSTYRQDSNCGVFMNGNKVGNYTISPSNFTMRYSVHRADGTVDSNTTFWYTFRYIRECSFVVSKNDATYVREANVYQFRPSFRYYFASSNYGFYNLSGPGDFNDTSGFYNTWINPSSFPLATCYVSETNAVPTTTTSTSDLGTKNAINNQTSTIEQGNTIAQQGNDIAQENTDTNKDTNNKITSFFNSFFDNLVHIFVPEDGFFSQWFNSLNDFMAQKLGFLWSPFDFMLQFLNGVYNGSGSASIVFPELAWIDGTVIIPRTEFSFDNIGGESFQDLRDMIYFSTDVILLGAVVAQFYKKVKLVFEGGGD